MPPPVSLAGDTGERNTPAAIAFHAGQRRRPRSQQGQHNSWCIRATNPSLPPRGGSPAYRLFRGVPGLTRALGFLVLWLIHLVGMSTLANLERTAVQGSVALEGSDAGSLIVGRRYATYRNLHAAEHPVHDAGPRRWLIMAR